MTALNSVLPLETSPRSQGFLDLDARLASAHGDREALYAVVSSADEASALLRHAIRRLSLHGVRGLRLDRRPSASLWCALASELGVRSSRVSAAVFASELGAAIRASYGALVVRVPVEGSWDSTVLDALRASLAGVRLVLVSVDGEPLPGFLSELVPHDLRGVLEDAAVARWYDALLLDSAGRFVEPTLASLESAYGSLRPAPAARVGSLLSRVSAHGRMLLEVLGLVDRPWPVTEFATLEATDDVRDELEALGAIEITGAQVAPLSNAWAALVVPGASHRAMEIAERALESCGAHDPWARLSASFLALTQGAPGRASGHLRSALGAAGSGPLARELLERFRGRLSLVAGDVRLALSVEAGSLALDAGEAELALLLARDAAKLAPSSAAAVLLFARASLSRGDTQSAKAALQRGSACDGFDGLAAEFEVEAAELAYLEGDLGLARSRAEELCARDVRATATRLRARNVVGKVLLAEARYEEAEVLFADDAWVAAAIGDRTSELRATVNRGIAKLSRGDIAEAKKLFLACHEQAAAGGELRASAYALDNLAVLACRQAHYAEALSFAERTLALRKQLGEQLPIIRTLANVADLREHLGLLDHADHAVRFGRAMMRKVAAPAHGGSFARVAARVALTKGDGDTAWREVCLAIAEHRKAGSHGPLLNTLCVAARIALSDGDLGRAKEFLDEASSLSIQDPVLVAGYDRAAAELARALGAPAEPLARAALQSARASGDEETILLAHALLGEILAADGQTDLARAELALAFEVRSRVALSLPDDLRSAYLSRKDFAALDGLSESLRLEGEPASVEDVSLSVREVRPSSVLPGRPTFVGDDPAIRTLRSVIRRVAKTDATVLVRGESGTGKELVADAIHRESLRAGGPLVKVNCGALVETLLLSELFGHEKGAFTGAMARKRGRFELAEGGTLFLDEIGEISPKTQVALLRVLQCREFERVGGTQLVRANVRVVCATNRDLRAMVERGEFREDLYYRLRGVTLEIPALRARLGDLPVIADYILDRIAADRRVPKKTLSADAMDLLRRHTWPGNVRELENVLRTADLFADEGVITAQVIAGNLCDFAQASPVSRRSLPPSTPPPAVDSLPSLHDEDGPVPESESSATEVAYTQIRQGGTSLGSLKRQIERDCIVRALDDTGGNITRAAALLGMKRPRLSQLVKQYGLSTLSSEAGR